METLGKCAFQIYRDSGWILSLHFCKTIYSHSDLGSSKDIYKELSILNPFHLVKGVSGRTVPLK